MTDRRLRHRILFATAMTLVALIAAASSAFAKAPASTPVGTRGWDISWPQCGGSLPRGGWFGIVGVTGGRSWSANSCLGQEYKWAARLPAAPGLYMNTANPAPHSSYFWPASGSYAPVLCSDATSIADPGCAYDYGWHTAANALSVATSTLGSAAAATSRTWWLDVEIGNTWNGTSSGNAADIQASIDYLKSQGVPVVGIYSTSYQWGQITGGYTTANSASYAAAWRPEFTSSQGISNSPDWVAGASGLSQAKSYCSASFTGVPAQLTQYQSKGFDANYRCR